MNNLRWFSGLLILAPASATAASLNMRILSAGQDTISVSACGESILYEVVASLSDTSSEGLAGFLLDLTFSGGPLAPADVASSGPMTSFVTPYGLNGPSGFGGEVRDGNLVLVGGAQNTIENTPLTAPAPVGDVVTGVGNVETVLVAGSLTVPTRPGTYVLNISSITASVIQQGQDGTGAVWLTEPVEVGTLAGLTVIVAPVAPATAGSSGPICSGSTGIILQGGPDGAAAYFWAGPDGFTSTQQNPEAPPVRGIYSLTVTDSNNCQTTAYTHVQLAEESWFELGPGECSAPGADPSFTLYALTSCLYGPAALLFRPDCGCVDFDASGSVDLADFAAYQAGFVP